MWWPSLLSPAPSSQASTCPGSRSSSAMAIGDLGLQDARSAGTEEDADAVAAVACRGAPGVVGEVVGAQAHLGDPVVAAVVIGELRRQGHAVGAGDDADPGVDVGGGLE